ncbi:MAG: histidine phosphatase family protein [Betaproteobacteria bacterium]|nr:histidine phosphatase family protein [Betaproteobacteria bacterium]
MELILWRHADAGDDAPDEERELTAKGVKQAQRIAAWLKERLPGDAVVLVSPAKRAQQTARALTGRFEVSREVGAAATPQSVLKAAGWPRAEGTVVVVGHQPTLGQTAALIMTRSAAEWGIPKGALWWLASRDPGETVVRAVIAPDLL